MNVCNLRLIIAVLGLTPGVILAQVDVASEKQSVQDNTPQGEDQENKIEALVGQLGSEKIEIREQATEELCKIAKPSEPALQKAKESKDPEVAARAKMILERIAGIKKDEKGRVIVMPGHNGWEVHLMRDEHDNVIEKRWEHPNNREAAWVRRYSYSIPDGKLVREDDIHGRSKVIQYDENGKATVVKQEDFIEEGDQYDYMPTPPPQPKKATEDKPAKIFPYDENNRPTEEKK